jgi:hypothetical protein
MIVFIRFGNYRPWFLAEVDFQLVPLTSEFVSLVHPVSPGEVGSYGREIR